MKQSLPTSQFSRPFLNRTAFGLIAFLTIHLLRSSSPMLSTVIQSISCILQVFAGVYYSAYLIRQRPHWLRNISDIPKGWKVTFALVLALLTISHCLPAQAAFYSAAETFMNSSFPQASTAVPLIFNALRAIFLIYVAIALISVMNSFRQGEEWLTVARSPAAVIIVVALGDVLTTIIVS